MFYLFKIILPASYFLTFRFQSHLAIVPLCFRPTDTRRLDAAAASLHVHAEFAPKRLLAEVHLGLSYR